MTALDASFQRQICRIARCISTASPSDDTVFIRSHLGRLEVARRPATLPRRLRTLLIVVDGRASVGELRRGLSAYRGFDEGLDMLRAMGLIEMLPAPLDT